MKKFLCLLLALVMSLSLVACGETKQPDANDGDDAATLSGTVVIYSTQTDVDHEVFLEVFNKEYSRIFGGVRPLGSCGSTSCAARFSAASRPFTEGLPSVVVLSCGKPFPRCGEKFPCGARASAFFAASSSRFGAA